MSQLLGRIGKLSKQRVTCLSELRSFSSTAATPYLLLNESNLRETTATGNEMVVDMNLYDPRKEERVKIPDQALLKELQWSQKIGSSKGWLGLKERSSKSTVRLTNIYNPCASVSSHKVITLPPLDDSVSSISLSASPNQQDCVVAAKSSSPFISLCRPGDSDWTRIKVPFNASRVSYSVRESKFYLHRASEKEYEGPIDLRTTCSDFPQVNVFQRFPNSDMPQSRQDQLISTMKIQYLVESPSGDSFIVYWCDEFSDRGKVESSHGKRPYRSISSRRRKPRAFVVFRQDPEQRIGSYTEDIGDLCIFLGNSEAFCVSAAEYPGLNPNSVYYAGLLTGFGYYDLSSNTLHDVIDPPPFSGAYLWLAPLQ
ncbi:hypothetical protein V5N11_021531 [Cardamine amara subsp. amara]|uniref:KIB1-4 beta-propeller domain-containing protein n=1 Tax=Cardamine amara subsp. amara TaxID=228776 RepID=A0ABD0ZYX6_CARAN